MSKLPFFSHRMVRRLRESAAHNVPQYGPDSSWLSAFAGSEPLVNESSQIVGPPPQLRIDDTDNPKQDATNARLVYTWLQGLTPTLAMEERLWACLSHRVFPQYMAVRWPVAGEAAIHRRYLLDGKGFAALSRNGISRLWWAGFLTHDPGRDNPFELTDVLFMRQDVHVSLLERALGKCRTVRTAVLEYLRNHQDTLSGEAFGRRIQLLLKELNLLGGVVVLDALTTMELTTTLEELGERLREDPS